MKLNVIFFIWLLFGLSEKTTQAQCCSISGNPIGGTVNLGLLSKNTLRVASFYRFVNSDQYYERNNLYTGEPGLIESATSNYIGLVSGYGITDKLTIEFETGYFVNKSFDLRNSGNIRGYGFSDAVISLKPLVYFDPDINLEISSALGLQIPSSRKLLGVNGVSLPIDLQPSTGSYGLVFQSNIIKENNYRMISFLFITRILNYFENDQNYLFGNSYVNSLYFSKFFFAYRRQLEGLSLIMQVRNQINEKDRRSGHTINGSGNYLVFIIPQINLSLNNNWNVSLLVDVPVYQYFHGIQIANKLSFALSINKDLLLAYNNR
jgi:hypothetical protein